MAEPIPVIIDTDIGEYIDDLLAISFVLNSPEFDLLAITTVDCDTASRSRIARRVTKAYKRPDIPVARGYTRSMPVGDVEVPPRDGVHQDAVAPTEDGLPPECELFADALIAKLAAERPGEITLLTIGSTSNVGYALVKYPETAKNLKQIVTNGGHFNDRQAAIGWNLRYDPVAAAVIARSEADWVLLSEGSTRAARLTHADEKAIAERGLETTDVITQAIGEWRKHKREVTAETTPHVSDMVGPAYLLDPANLTVRRGKATILVPPRHTLGGLQIEWTDDGPHTLGWAGPDEKMHALHALFMQRILAEPRGARGGT